MGMAVSAAIVGVLIFGCVVLRAHPETYKRHCHPISHG